MLYYCLKQLLLGGEPRIEIKHAPPVVKSFGQLVGMKHAVARLATIVATLQHLLLATNLSPGRAEIHRGHGGVGSYLKHLHNCRKATFQEYLVVHHYLSCLDEFINDRVQSMRISQEIASWN